MLRKRRDRTEQRVADVASGGGRHAQQALGRGIEPGCALQQHVTQPARDLAVPAAGGGEELFGEEGVAFGASDDRVGQRGWRGGIRVSREQRRQLLAPERAEFEQQPRTRAPDAIGEPAHALGRGELVRAIGRQQQDRAAGEVVGEENDEIERGGIGPVHVLEHQQHRRGDGVIGE